MEAAAEAEREERALVAEALRRTAGTRPAAFPPAAFTEEAFAWALRAVRRRALRVADPAAGAAPFLALVPVLDVTPHTTDRDAAAGGGAVLDGDVVRVGIGAAGIGEGEEPALSRGNLTDAQVLSRFGAASLSAAANPSNALRLRPPPPLEGDSPDVARRRAAAGRTCGPVELVAVAPEGASPELL